MVMEQRDTCRLHVGLGEHLSTSLYGDFIPSFWYTTVSSLGKLSKPLSCKQWK